METVEHDPPGGFAEVIARWQERLLDLTKRNRLLYFKPGRSAVRIASHTANEICEQLQTQSRGGLAFRLRGKKPNEEADFR